MKTIIVTTIVAAVAITITSGCRVKTIHQDNREKLIELLERSQKLEQKIDQLNEAMHSITNQMFMIPVFPDPQAYMTNAVAPL